MSAGSLLPNALESRTQFNVHTSMIDDSVIEIATGTNDVHPRLPTLVGIICTHDKW